MSQSLFEFSRRYPVKELWNRNRDLEIRAKNHECKALARRFSLLTVRSLEAEIQPVRLGKGLRLKVRYDCLGDQECVVSLAAVPFVLSRRFQADFATGKASSPDSPIEVRASDHDAIDHDAIDYVQENDFMNVFEADILDIGECVAQHLGSSLDPYPRLPDAVLPQADWRPGIEIDGGAIFHAKEDEQSPFHVLASLKKRKE